MAGDSPSHALTNDAGAIATDAILDICDRLLEEVGRRQHRFAWLRAPGSAADEWLPVDGYYPARRLVVSVRAAADAPDTASGAPFGELIAAHGLRLLDVSPAELGGDPEGALREQIAALALAPREDFDRSVGASVPRETAISRMSASLAQATAPPARQRAQRTPRTGQASGTAAVAVGTRSDPAIAVGVVIGVALTIAIGIELYIGVGAIALGDRPHWLLAFGFALDAVARALGTVAGERAGRLDWSLWSMIGGSPAVAAITLFRREGRMTTEPGPIAGLMSVAAMTMIALWLAGALLGV